MTTFWNTIAAYNAATWPAQIVLTAAGIVLTTLLYVRPSAAVRNTTKGYMALLNFWIAFVYFQTFGLERSYHAMLTIFWAIMGCIWIYDLVMKHPTLDRTERHTPFALLMLLLPLAYPLFSLALGREFPEMTMPVMPCSVAVFTIGLMLAFSVRLNLVLAMLLCHWALVGLSKVYTYGIPEDFLLAFSVIPTLYIFFRGYIRDIQGRPSKPSPRVMNILLILLCALIGISCTLSLLHQLGLFAGIA